MLLQGPCGLSYSCLALCRVYLTHLSRPRVSIGHATNVELAHHSLGTDIRAEVTRPGVSFILTVFVLVLTPLEQGDPCYKRAWVSVQI